MFLVALGLMLAAGDPADAWGECLSTRAETLSKGAGTPESIADAAMRACAAEELDVRRSVEKEGGNASAKEVSGLLNQMTREMRQEMVQAVIDMRRARSGGTPPRTAAKPAAASAPAGEKWSFKITNNAPGASQVTGFVMINSKGVESANLISSRIAPGASRTLTFPASRTVCKSLTEVTLSNGNRYKQPIDYCQTKEVIVGDNELILAR